MEFVWSYIKNVILQLMDLFIPQIRIRPHSSPKWFTPNIRYKLNRIHYLRRKAKNRPMDYVLAKFELAESELQADIADAKSKYESSLIHDFAFSKSYKIYEYIKSLKKEDILPQTVFNSNLSATCDSDKAYLFNEYFHSVFTTSSYRLSPLDEIDTPTSVVTNIILSDSDVYSALTSLDPTKSSGTDGIGPKLLKVGAIALYIYTSPQVMFVQMLNCIRMEDSSHYSHI